MKLICIYFFSFLFNLWSYLVCDVTWSFKLSSHEGIVRNARQYNQNFRSLESRATDKSIIRPLGSVRRKLKFEMSSLELSLDDEFLMGDLSITQWWWWDTCIQIILTWCNFKFDQTGWNIEIISGNIWWENFELIRFELGKLWRRWQYRNYHLDGPYGVFWISVECMRAWGYWGGFSGLLPY